MIIAYYIIQTDRVLQHPCLVTVVAQKLLYVCICGSTSMRSPKEVTTAAHTTLGDRTAYVRK